MEANTTTTTLLDFRRLYYLLYIYNIHLDTHTQVFVTIKVSTLIIV